MGFTTSVNTGREISLQSVSQQVQSSELSADVKKVINTALNNYEQEIKQNKANWENRNDSTGNGLGDQLERKQAELQNAAKNGDMDAMLRITEEINVIQSGIDAATDIIKQDDDSKAKILQ